MTRTTKRLWIGCGLAVGLVGGFLVEERVRGNLELQAWERAMRARGDLLSIAELDPLRSNTTARVVSPTDLMSLLPAGVTQNHPASPRTLPPGREAVLWRLEPGWDPGEPAKTWEGLARELASTRAELPALRAALTNQPLLVRLNYQDGFSAPLPHLGPLKGAIQVLRTATLLDLHEGRLEEALENLLAARAVLDIQRREGVLINQLVRMAIGSISLGAVWQALQADGWSDAQLARLQAAWQEPGFIAGMAAGLRMERAVAASYFSAGRMTHAELASTFEMVAPFGGSGGALGEEVGWLTPLLEAGGRLRRGVFVEVWRFAWRSQDQVFHHRALQSALDAAGAVLLDHDARGLRFDSEPHDTSLPARFWPPPLEQMGLYDRLRHWLSMTTLAATDTALQKASQVECHAGLTVAAIALHRYRLRHGRWPEQLAALVPEFLPAVPRDWMDGNPLRYRLDADGSFTLYSVGSNGVDEGGDPRPEKGDSHYLLHGRDVVWPQPATPEELQEAPTTARRGSRNP